MYGLLPKISEAHLYGESRLKIKKHKKSISMLSFCGFKKKKKNRSQVIERLTNKQNDWKARFYQIFSINEQILFIVIVLF